MVIYPPRTSQNVCIKYQHSSPNPFPPLDHLPPEQRRRASLRPKTTSASRVRLQARPVGPPAPRTRIARRPNGPTACATAAQAEPVVTIGRPVSATKMGTATTRTTALEMFASATPSSAFTSHKTALLRSRACDGPSRAGDPRQGRIQKPRSRAGAYRRGTQRFELAERAGFEPAVGL